MYRRNILMKSIHAMDYLFDLISIEYSGLIKLYEQQLRSFTYNKFTIDNTSTVFQIEDLDIFYLGIKQNYGSHKVANLSSVGRPDDFGLPEEFYIVHIELTYNEFFNFNDSNLKRQFEPKRCNRLFISFNDVYEGYFGRKNYNPLSISYSFLYEYINKIQPNLNLLERIDMWKDIN
jgi:hypothetical protein